MPLEDMSPLLDVEILKDEMLSELQEVSLKVRE